MTKHLLKNSWRSTLALAMGLVVGTAILAYVATGVANGPRSDRAPVVSDLRSQDIPFDGERAYGYLKSICELGPRPSGSRGMQRQQALLERHFADLGGRVRWQRFRARHPLDGSPVSMANLIVEWHPRRRERILLCAHYDTRPFPDEDPVNPRGTFVGANDGASGVAVLMGLAHEIHSLQGRLGVDFAFFDAEEFVFRDTDTYFLGSEYFSRAYAGNPPPYRYRHGVLLDMVADADLQIYQERNSVWWPDTKPLVDDIWATAARLGVREFIPQKKYEIRDDHLKLRNIGGIPTCDIIDFDYPYWHTEGDTHERCSALSLAKVGWVVREWLRSAVE